MKFTLQKEEIQRTSIIFSLYGDFNTEKGRSIKKKGKKLERYTRKHLPALDKHVFTAPAASEHLYCFEVWYFPTRSDGVEKWIREKAMSMGMILTTETRT